MKRRLRRIDQWSFLALVLLVGIGVLVILSTTLETPREPLFKRHLVSLGAGLVAFTVMSLFPYRYLDALAVPLYVLGLVGLGLVLAIGLVGFGAQRWLSVGPVMVQPAEFAKLTTLVLLARFLAGRTVNPRRPDVIARAAFIVLVPMAFVLKQPDLGTALAFGGLLVAVLFWAGTPFSWLLYVAALVVTGLLTYRLPPVTGWSSPPVSGSVAASGAWLPFLKWGAFLALVLLVLRFGRRRRRLVVATLVAHVVVGLSAPLAWHRLEEYQRIRVLTFLDPGRDPSGAGYQVIQSEIAIGSGQLLGKGYLGGTQKALAYLPQQHTDFVFSVVGEEFGFVGSLVVIALFLLLLTRGLRVAHLARDRFGSLLAAGAVGILAYHVVVNLFMTMGLAPVTGLPLPFISYGGSFFVLSMSLAGLLQSIAVRRHGY